MPLPPAPYDACLLGNHLKALKLPTFAREYEKVAMESAQDRADYPHYLLRLCELERIDRERRMVERRIRLARFPQTKSLDTFDFTAQPSLNKALVLELARCEWIEKRHNCIALGPSGTGKTHAALALGLAACQRGHSVAFTTERGATLVTSNLPFDEWTSVLGSERLTGALLDRLTHHVHILEMNGESFRLATSKKAQRRPGHEQNAGPKAMNEGDPITEI
jgi:DNA replication protein DnaC